MEGIMIYSKQKRLLPNIKTVRFDLIILRNDLSNKNEGVNLNILKTDLCNINDIYQIRKTTEFSSIEAE